MLKDKKTLFATGLCLILISCGDCESEKSQLAAIPSNPVKAVIVEEETEGEQVEEAGSEQISADEPYGLDQSPTPKKPLPQSPEVTTAKAALAAMVSIVGMVGIVAFTTVCGPAERFASGVLSRVKSGFSREAKLETEKSPLVDPIDPEQAPA
jgi:hypothetical protein